MTGLFIFAGVIGIIWIEVIFFGLIGGTIGVLPTIIGVFLTAMLGIRLSRYYFSKMMTNQMTMMMHTHDDVMMEPPQQSAIIAPVFGAVLLLIPGYATDALGLIFFIPGLGGYLAALLLRLPIRPMAGRMQYFYAGSTPYESPQEEEEDEQITIIEGKIEKSE